MSQIPAEIVKEYRVRVNGMEETVYGRIIKSVKGDDSDSYLGELSHYCKPHVDAFDEYRPSLLRSDLDSVEHLLTRYLESFTTIGVVKNEFY